MTEPGAALPKVRRMTPHCSVDDHDIYPDRCLAIFVDNLARFTDEPSLRDALIARSAIDRQVRLQLDVVNTVYNHTGVVAVWGGWHGVGCCQQGQMRD